MSEHQEFMAKSYWTKWDFTQTHFLVDEVNLGGRRRKVFKVFTQEMLGGHGEFGHAWAFGQDGLPGSFLPCWRPPTVSLRALVTGGCLWIASCDQGLVPNVVQMGPLGASPGCLADPAVWQTDPGTHPRAEEVLYLFPSDSLPIGWEWVMSKLNPDAHAFSLGTITNLAA